MSDVPKKRPWLLRVHYAMRTMSFMILFIAAAAQINGGDNNVNLWVFLVAFLVVYPHVQYWRASRAANPTKAEMRNLLIDSILLGFFIVSIKFSQWIAFSAVTGTLLN